MGRLSHWRKMQLPAALLEVYLKNTFVIVEYESVCHEFANLGDGKKARVLLLKARDCYSILRDRAAKGDFEFFLITHTYHYRKIIATERE